MGLKQRKVNYRQSFAGGQYVVYEIKNDATI